MRNKLVFNVQTQLILVNKENKNKFEMEFKKKTIYFYLVQKMSKVYIKNYGTLIGNKVEKLLKTSNKRF